MPLDVKESTGVEVPLKWKKCTLKNCPYYLTLKDYPYHFWDQIYIALGRATGSGLGHHIQGHCRRPCEDTGPTSSHDVILTRGTRANDQDLARMLDALVDSMPEIGVVWEE